MDKDSQAIFDSILAMDKANLSTEQLGFLMARRSYMNDEQRKRYADEIKAHEGGLKKSKKEE